MSGLLEVARQRLNTAFSRRFVKEYEPTLAIVFFTIQPAEELIEAAAKLFESYLHNILSCKIFLPEHSCKETNISRMMVCNALSQSVDYG